MQENFEVKHNLKGAFFLGLIVSVGLFIIFFVSKGLEVPYIKDAPFLIIFLPILFIGIYIIWSNYYLRKIIIKKEECTYVNMFGRKKKFQLDEIEKIISNNSDNVILYNNAGIKICKLEVNMENMEEFQEYVYIKKGLAAKCSQNELAKKVEQNYVDFINHLKIFFMNKESLGIMLEYGFQVEDEEESIFYILKFRAKNVDGYLGQNFLKIGYWEYKIIFIGYKKNREIALYCDKKELDDYLQKLYEELVRRVKKKYVIKKGIFVSYEMMEQLNI